MTQPAPSQNQQHSQLPPQYRQALAGQEQQQQKQTLQPPSLQEIEQKYSQLPPQYRQAVLEKQQREYQQQLLEQKQQKQRGQQQPQQQQQQKQQQQRREGEPTPSPTTNTPKEILGSWSPTRQRNVSAPMKSIYRAERDSDSMSMSTTSSRAGPGRAHWKPDSGTLVCTWPGCRLEFGFFDRRHHCRKCGDIFCSAHCSREVPLDQALDFNPSEGVMSRACVGCYEAYEQWQGNVPVNSYGTSSALYQMQCESDYEQRNSSTTSSTSSNQKRNIGRIPDGFLGGSSSEEFGREDIVRQPQPAPGNIAIKKRPSTDQTVMPMPSVPHDWSWSTF